MNSVSLTVHSFLCLINEILHSATRHLSIDNFDLFKLLSYFRLVLVVFFVVNHSISHIIFFYHDFIGRQ